MLAPDAALSTLALFPATLQIRFFFDPIVQFSLHMQVALELVLLGLVGLAAYVRFGRRFALLVAAVVAYTGACLIYEPTYAFALLFVATAIVSIPLRRRQIAIAAAFIAPPLLCAGVAFWLRAQHPLPPGDQHSIHASLGPVVSTFVTQALGAIPFSYRVYDPGHIFPVSDRWSDATWLVAIMAFLILAVALRDTRIKPPRDVAVASIAALAWLLSGVIVAFSPRWQVELSPGLAYIPVYFGDAAMAVLLACALRAIASLSRPLAPYAVAVVGASIIASTYSSNTQAMARYESWNTTLPRALDSRVLRAPEGAIVFLDASYPAQTIFTPSTWNAKYYLYYHTGVRYDAQPLTALPRTVPPRAFVVIGFTQGFVSGTAIGGAINGATTSTAGVVPLVSSVERFTPDTSQRLSQWVSRCGPVPATGVLNGVASPLTIDYGTSFFPEEQDGPQWWRWSASNAVLVVSNPTDARRVAQLRFTLRPVEPQAHLSIVGEGATIHTVASNSDVNTTVSIAVARGGSVTLRIASDGTTSRCTPSTLPAS